MTVESNFQTLLLANPCWLSLLCWGCVGAPKQGKTTGMPWLEVNVVSIRNFIVAYASDRLGAIQRGHRRDE